MLTYTAGMEKVWNANLQKANRNTLMNFVCQHSRSISCCLYIFSFPYHVTAHEITDESIVFVQIQAVDNSDEYDRLVAAHGSYFADMGISRMMTSRLQDRSVVIKTILQHLILYR